MTEVWKDIPGYEGWYQVSNLGRVRSLDRVIEQWSRYGHTIHRDIKGQFLTPTDNGYGYMIVGLATNQIRRNYYVHQLVAEAFIPNPEGKSEVNHKDYDKTNNAASNLEWVTRLENVHYSQHRMRKPRNKCRPTNTGEKYISMKNGKFRLNLGKVCDKRFNTLDEAVAMREVFIGDGKHYAR